MHDPTTIGRLAPPPRVTGARRAFCTLGVLCALCATCIGDALATLHDRGGGLIYDDQLNITWLQDANYANSAGYVTPGGRAVTSTSGRMEWNEAQAWAAQLVYGGYGDWRLPTLSPGNPPYNNPLGHTPVGYGATGNGWGLPGDADGIWSEMGWMYYHNLGGIGACAPNTPIASCLLQPGWGLPGNGPFIHIDDYFYWSNLENPTSSIDDSWSLDFFDGEQWYYQQGSKFSAWAVRDGDVSINPPDGNPIPEPAMPSLLALALSALLATRRRA